MQTQNLWGLRSKQWVRLGVCTWKSPCYAFIKRSATDGAQEEELAWSGGRYYRHEILWWNETCTFLPSLFRYLCRPS